jgi:hypothetical protein
MSGCFSPVALAGAQSRFARAWFARASLSWFAMGIQAFEAQSAAMAPIRQMVTANAERLGGRDPDDPSAVAIMRIRQSPTYDGMASSINLSRMSRFRT